jgi:CRISPR system Cascade subunit CasA
MLGYEIREATLKGSDKKVKKKFSITFEDKGLWREFDSLLPGESGLSPAVVENAVALTKRLVHRFPDGLMALGQKYYPPRPNIAFWKKELFTLPAALLGDRAIRSDIHRFLSVSEDAERALYAACTSFAKHVLGHGDRKVEQADISEFVKQIGATPSYWSQLEIRFHELLHAYSIEADPDAIEHQWLKFVRVALKDAWKLQENSISGSDAWSLRALVKAEVPIRRKLTKLDSKIAEYQTNQPEENG